MTNLQPRLRYASSALRAPKIVGCGVPVNEHLMHGRTVAAGQLQQWAEQAEVGHDLLICWLDGGA